MFSSDDILSTVFLGGVLFLLIYYYSTSTYDYWKKRGVPFPKPFPLLGNSIRQTLTLSSTKSEQNKFYYLYPNERFVGKFVLRTPILFLRDPDIIHTILIPDFAYFYNRGINIDEKIDPLAQHLVNLKDQKWKNLRNKLTPVFSSGKLKFMHNTLVTCTDSLVESLSSYVKEGKPIEAREVMSGFTMDVIGHCAFGLQVNALNNPNSEFRKMGQEVFRPTIKGKIRIMARTVFPKLISFLKWKSLSQSTEDFFIGVIREAIETRDAHKINVNDFLQLLINIRKEELEKKNTVVNDDELIFDDLVMTANAFVFFLAGFETTASTLSFCLFELAQNPDIQEKLRCQVDEILAKHNGIPSFEAVKEMTYMENVISETLRKYSPVTTLIRECTKNYQIPDSSVVIPKGMLVQIPVDSLHHDPKYYPDPSKFNPDRFDGNIRKGTYLPFGDGPRICIGMRFAKIEMKVALSIMLKHFKFSPNEKTPSPLEFHPRSFLLAPINGIWLNVDKR